MNNAVPNLVFTGFMGTGKSSVAKQAALELNLKFVDVDKEIEHTASMSISDIFASFGEEYFRKIESQMIKEYSLKTGMVISTGGGVVLNTENIKNLRKNGIIILLKARPEVIFRNVSKDKSRPLLNYENPMNRIIELLEQRKPYYENNDFEIDVSELSIEEAAEKAVEIFKNSCRV
ncbi:MAG: shikimate kinase [Deltaproteobacteria bacterium]